MYIYIIFCIIKISHIPKYFSCVFSFGFLCCAIGIDGAGIDRAGYIGTGHDGAGKSDGSISKENFSILVASTVPRPPTYADIASTSSVPSTSQASSNFNPTTAGLGESIQASPKAQIATLPNKRSSGTELFPICQSYSMCFHHL